MENSREGCVQGYWIKNLSNLHERIPVQRNKTLMGDDSLPAWVTHGRTVLCQQDPRKGNAVENYRPITFFTLIWKLLTGVIAEDMYDYLEQEKLLPEEQKGCRRGSRGTKDQLLIDKTVLKVCKKRHMVSLSLILRKVSASYKWGKKECKLNHSLFMDDLKLFSKSEEQMDTLVRTVYVFSTDIGMEFGTKKCGILSMKRGKVVRCEGISFQIVK